MKRCIDVEFPKGTELTQLELMREAHSAFASARQRVYIGSQDYFNEIHKYRNENITQPFVILGESGDLNNCLCDYCNRKPLSTIFHIVAVSFIGGGNCKSLTNYIT